MIGPGTGIAPMRALLQERQYQSVYGPTVTNDSNISKLRTRSTSIDLPKPNKANRSSSKEASYEIGTNALYFGCRNDVDYIYQDELKQFQDKKILHELHVAYSRLPNQKKVYVQHVLQEEAKAKSLLTSLDNGGYIYVCGGTSMGTDVMETIIQLLITNKSWTKEKANAYIKQLQEEGRYVQELWSA